MIRPALKPMIDTSIVKSVRPPHDNKDKSDKLTTTGLIINLINDITPNGILPLSAAFVSSELPVALAVALMAASAASSWWTINILASLQDTYDRQASSAGPSLTPFASLHSLLLSPRHAWAVDVMLASLCFWCCVTYVDFAVDLLTPSLAFVCGSWWSRSWSVGLLVWAVLYPLCSLKDLAALAPFSTLGAASVVFVSLFMCLRAADGSYEPGGAYHSAYGGSSVSPDGGSSSGATNIAEGTRSIAELVSQETSPTAAFNVGARSLFEAATATAGTPELSPAPLRLEDQGEYLVYLGFWKAASTLFQCCQLLALSSVGFLSHYNAGDYYRGLLDATPRKFATASGLVFGGAFVAYSAVMVAGAATFGQLSAPTILSSYHSTADGGAVVGRLGIGLSLLTSFPLMFNGLRRSTTLLLAARQLNDPNTLSSLELSTPSTTPAAAAAAAAAASSSAAGAAAGAKVASAEDSPPEIASCTEASFIK